MTRAKSVCREQLLLFAWRGLFEKKKHKNTRSTSLLSVWSFPNHSRMHTTSQLSAGCLTSRCFMRNERPLPSCGFVTYRFDDRIRCQVSQVNHVAIQNQHVQGIEAGWIQRSKKKLRYCRRPEYRMFLMSTDRILRKHGRWRLIYSNGNERTRIRQIIDRRWHHRVQWMQ